MKFGLIGDPVASSRSPAMHAAAYAALGLAHTYEAIRARPEELAHYTDLVRSGALAGLNVTVPHKEAILAHVDDVDASARVVRAANTLVRAPNGRVVAYNTDVPALADEIRALIHATAAQAGGVEARAVQAAGANVASADGAATLRGATAIVTGSGGASRAAVCAIARDLGAAIVVVRARTFENDAACTQFRAAVADVLDTTTLHLLALGAPRAAAENGASVVVQGTSAGMTGKDLGEDIARAIDFAALAKGAVAIDCVYAPLETPFLRAARAAGVVAVNGLGMLARQGARAFELWLGVPAPYEAMRAAID